MTAVLGGPHNNEVHLPAQLLPLMVGAFGFIRTLYLILMSERSPESVEEPSVADSDPRPLRLARTLHMRDIPFAFSPHMARYSTTTSHDPDEIDEREKHRSWPVRYLVTWLPWLSLLGYFQNETVRERNKRWSGHSDHEKRWSLQTLGQHREVRNNDGQAEGSSALRHGETA